MAKKPIHSMSTPETTAPKMVANTSITASTPPSFPRFDLSEISVVQAETPESLPMEPKKLITASAATTAPAARISGSFGSFSVTPKRKVKSLHRGCTRRR